MIERLKDDRESGPDLHRSQIPVASPLSLVWMKLTGSAALGSDLGTGGLIASHPRRRGGQYGTATAKILPIR